MDTDPGEAVWGCVIGRFQPFHRDHLSLVCEAFQECGRVIVAVTNADPTWQNPVKEAPHRHLPESNPYTFWQRHELIAAAVGNVIPPQSVRIVPFPLHDATLWSFYLPETVECWVRDRGTWEARKIAALQDRYRVHVAPPVADEVSGTRVRELLAADDPTWRTLVPSPVARKLDEWRLKTGVAAR